MIKDNSLSDRLNKFKKKSESPDDEISSLTNNPNSIFYTISSLLAGIIVVLKIFVFGYSMKIIFNTDWSLISTLCIGLGIQFILMYIYDLFS